VNGLFLFNRKNYKYMSWETNRAPFDANRTPVLVGVSKNYTPVPGDHPDTVVPVAVDPSNGYLMVESSGGGGGGLSVTDGASFTAGTSDFTPTGGEYQAPASATQLTAGDQGTLALSINRSAMIAYEFPAVATATWTASTSLNATEAVNTVGLGTVTVTSVETGTTTTAGALTFEVYDGTNWWAIQGQQTGSYTLMSSYTLVNGTNVAWQFDVGGFQQFRVRLSTAITGTGSPQVVLIIQAMAAPNDVTPTVGWGQLLSATVGDSITSYPFGHTYTHITTDTTTTAKSGAGVLHSITINQPVASSVITIWDNTAASGTSIGIITLPSSLLSEGPMNAIFDVAFSTGLTIQTATGASDLTVSWR
jgi:hypothetical protein